MKYKEIQNYINKEVIKISETKLVKIRGRWKIKRDKNTTSKEIKLHIYNLIKDKGPLTREKICKLTNMRRTTAYDYLVPLIREKKIEKFPKGNKKRGRPTVYYRIVSENE